MRISDWSSDVCSSDLAFGVVPADQSLDPGDHVRPRVDDRLIIQFHLSAGQCVAHILFQAAAILGCLVQVARIEAESPAPAALGGIEGEVGVRSEEHTSELQSLMRSSYAVLCLTKKKQPEN